MNEGQPIGTTASAFVAVSLEPALVSVCIKRGSWTSRQLRTLERLGISFLGHGHAATARQAAQATGDRFLELHYEEAPSGADFLTSPTAWLECSIANAIPASDHDMVLFRLVAAATVGVMPLIFHSSDFPTIAHRAVKP